jgi:hypothetical protein
LIVDLRPAKCPADSESNIFQIYHCSYAGKGQQNKFSVKNYFVKRREPVIQFKKGEIGL